VDRNDLYAHPYEEVRLELHPSAGAGMIIERRIPQLTNTVMAF
jgi:archaellin